MKNLSFLYSLLVVLICICTTKSFAHDIEVKNIDGVTIYYSWRNNVTELAVDYFGIDDYEPIRGFYSGEVFIPESVEYGGKKYKVTAIYDCAFMHCMGLTSVTIPNSVTFIGDRAFGGCSSLTSVTIPNGVTFISSEVFGSCGGLISIKVDSGNQTYDSRNNCNAIIETLSNTLIAGCKNTIIPNTVTSIGNEAFYGCNSLTSATIPSSVTTIGNNAFHGCSGLSSVAIPNSVTSIGSWAFSGCSGLTSVAIPNSVTSIGFRAFNFCSELASVISEIANPFEIDNSVFDGIPSDAQLIVPKGTKAKYQVTAGWNQFSNIIEADSGGANLSINGINYQISSESEHTIMVSKGDYGQLLDVPATISYGNNTWSVNGVKDGALDDCNELAAIIWNPSIAFNARVSNPNLLLYVKDKAYKSPDIKNVVVNGVAESIELTDAASGNDFYCPRAFTARKISYTHDYKMETGIGESKGWETIVLPFDVQKYTHATKGEIEPFTTWTMGSNKKPFWLFELAEDGYRDVAGIKANTPYITQVSEVLCSPP